MTVKLEQLTYTHIPPNIHTHILEYLVKNSVITGLGYTHKLTIVDYCSHNTLMIEFLHCGTYTKTERGAMVPHIKQKTTKKKYSVVFIYAEKKNRH